MNWQLCLKLQEELYNELEELVKENKVIRVGLKDGLNSDKVYSYYHFLVRIKSIDFWCEILTK